MLFLVAIAVAFVTVFSFSTSPLYEFHDHNDSGVYLLMGKMWSQGFLPYVDYWELKGPVIFLIDAIGYWLTGTRFGAYCIQLIFMTISLIWVYKTCRLSMAKPWALGGGVFFLICLFNIYEAGNLIEEYTLPLLVISWYLQYKWIDGYVEHNITEHKPWYAAFYGLVFAFCLFTRLTDALGLCGGVMFITILLLTKKEFSNLGKNIVGFLGGFSILFIPLTLYFYINDALYEMWYGTLLFGLSYASSSFHSITSGGTLNTFFRTYIDVYCCMTVGVFTMLLNRKRWLVGLWMLSISILLWWWLVNSNGYGHYGMLAVSYCAIILKEAYRLIREGKVRIGRYATVGVLCIYALMAGSKDLMIAKVTSPYPIGSIEVRFNKVLEQVPRKDYPFVAVYQATPYFYLKYDVTPCYKYPAYVDFLWGMDENLDADAMTVFSTCKAKWFVVDRDHLPALHIDPLLKKRYTLVTTYQDMYLYRRSD